MVFQQEQTQPNHTATNEMHYRWRLLDSISWMAKRNPTLGHGVWTRPNATEPSGHQRDALSMKAVKYYKLDHQTQPNSGIHEVWTRSNPTQLSGHKRGALSISVKRHKIEINIFLSSPVRYFNLFKSILDSLI